MVAYNLRKVENRDRYPDPPYTSRNSLVAGLRVVAAAAWVRFPVSASLFWKKQNWSTRNTVIKMKLEGFEPPTFGSGIRRAAIAPWLLDSKAPLIYIQAVGSHKRLLRKKSFEWTTIEHAVTSAPVVQ